MANWQESIERYQLLEKGDRILIGVSGGPDSMALLHLLEQSVLKYDCSLYVVHVNHLIRGEQADQEADFVQKWCEDHHIPVRIFRSDVQALANQLGLSIEAAGHKARFAAFEAAAAIFGTNKLALGHHRDDRAETVMMHILQGCGLDGLAVMPPKDGALIRPLIEANKAALLAYCQRWQLPYYWDQSNDEPIYLRNRLRLELMPHLQQDYNPQITEALVRLAMLADEDSTFINEMAQQAWQQCVRTSPQQASIDLNLWRKLPTALQRRVLRQGYGWLRPHHQGLTYQQSQMLMQLARSDDGTKQWHLPDGVAVEKTYQQLMFYEHQVAEKKEGYVYEWNLAEKLWVAEIGAWFQAEFSNAPLSYTPGFTQVILDADKIGTQLLIRTRQPGDRLQPLGLQGEKKLKNYFIDKKVPSKGRDRWPLVYSGEKLIWLPGLTISQAAKVTQQSRNFCRLTVFLSDEAGFLVKRSETN